MIYWKHPSYFRFFLMPETHMHKMSSFKQDADDKPESGGILLGYRKGGHLEVTAITTPGPRDIRERSLFHRLDPSHQSVATKLWEQSSHEIDYLGEWHTHPELSPTPSSLDIREWSFAVNHHKKPLIGLIIGIESNYLSFLDVNGHRQLMMPAK